MFLRSTFSNCGRDVVAARLRSIAVKPAKRSIILSVGLVATLAALVCASAAQAELTIEPGSFNVTTTSNKCSRTAPHLQFTNASCSTGGGSEWGWEQAAEAQAGAHADLTTSFALLTDSEGSTDGNLRNVEVELPAGISGSPAEAPTCTEAELLQNGEDAHTDCPINSQIGVVALKLNLFGGATPEVVTLPVFNMGPHQGQAAEFGFDFSRLVVSNIVLSVRPTDYGVDVADINITGSVEVDGISVTIWGVPAAESHNEERGDECYESEGTMNCEGGGRPPGENPRPFLNDPTRCTHGPLTATLRVESWQGGQGEATTTVAPFTGCEHLAFDPTISVEPTVTQADVPSQYTLDLSVPQSEDPLGLASADLRKAVITLPEGVALSPGAAAGLQACTEAQIGIGTSSPPACPPASKLGEATLTTPALSHPLTGSIYLAGPESGPITGPPFRVFLALAGEGVMVKLPGSVEPNPVTGQLTATFAEDPQLPFTELQTQFTGGPGAPLANPQTCGEARTTTDLTPWSSPEARDADPFSSFDVTGCAASMPFSPAFSAGTVSPAAGSFSPLTLTLSRNDGEQDLAGASLTLPPGVAGMVSNVSLCPEPQASLGSCSEASRIGTVHVAAGAGSEPLWLEGPVYLTGSYKGAPFGLSVVVPAVAGPFNLGNVIERAAINVNPVTSQVTATSDLFPQIRNGVPLRLKTVNVTIDRPSFMFNPTDCAPMSIAGAVSSSEGASEGVSSRFQAANCATLPFDPKFTVSTQGKTSKADGASLDVKLASKGGPQAGGGEANIKAVKVDLPKQLPSRLTTLQKACTEAQFDANPAGCPAASDVGAASATTPIFSHPLTGPAYFVSRGGQAFPDLEIVLQGEGITLILDGNTDIKKGITSSIFRSVPDAPITDFELKLPAGPYSILGTNLPASADYSLCGQTLNMPTAFVGQNGAEIHTSTPISVEGCKPAIRVLRRHVKGDTATLLVSVPAAGRLVAKGRGLSKAKRKVKHAGTVRVKLKLTKGEAAFLKRHRGRRLKANVYLRFTPRKGGRLTARTSVLIR